MKELGWDKKPGVTILFGRWQDVLPALEQSFDGIFFDTYGGETVRMILVYIFQQFMLTLLFAL
jgi:hypothetical protein